jgi:hypothetical protein
MRLTITLSLLACLTVLTACGGPSFEAAPLIGSLPDATQADAGLDASDAPSSPDAEPIDGGAPDGAHADGLPPDAPLLDAGDAAAPPCGSDASACGIVELATNQVVPSGLAVGDGTVFWTTEGAAPDYVGNVVALSLLEPTAIPTVIATNQKYPRALTFVDRALYWGSYGDGAIGKWTAARGLSPIGTAPRARIYSVVADSAHVYFAMEVTQPDGGLPTGAIGRCPLDGCQGTPEILATAEAKIIGLAIDRGALFWSVYSRNGAIYRLTLDGTSSPQPIAVGQSSPLNVTTFGGFVYWVNNTASGTVLRVSASAVDEMPTILASNQPMPWGIAADEQAVYWTTYAPMGQIMKLAHGTSVPIVLAAGQSNPRHVRVDANFAYWTTGDGSTAGDGSIRRVAK